MNESNIKEIINECLEEIFFSADEGNIFSNLQDKVNKLLYVAKYEERLDISIKNCHRFEDYMKNVDKLNGMINEFKGLVAIVRGEAQQVKTQNAYYKKTIKKLLEALESDE